jgi:hypothetical protein
VSRSVAYSVGESFGVLSLPRKVSFMIGPSDAMLTIVAH